MPAWAPAGVRTRNGYGLSWCHAARDANLRAPHLSLQHRPSATSAHPFDVAVEQSEERFWKRVERVSWIAAPVGVMIAVAAAYMGVASAEDYWPFQTGTPRVEQPPPSTEADESTSSTVDVSTSTPPVAEVAALDAPVIATSMADLRVHNFCLCGGPRDQIMLKMKLEVVNTGSDDIDAGSGLDSNIRLIVQGDADEWSAPWGDSSEAMFQFGLDPDDPVVPGQAAGARSNDAWAIATNPDGRAESTESGGFTFATHWPADLTLSPGEGYLDPDAKSGDLVFYLPLGPSDDLEILGVGILGPSGPGGSFGGFTPITSWDGENSDPNAF